MDATDLLVDPVLGDDDTEPSIRCLQCAARANLESAAMRAGVERITTVSEYRRPPISRCAVESTKALLCLPGGVIARGDGHSREDAIASALEQAGVLR